MLSSSLHVVETFEMVENGALLLGLFLGLVCRIEIGDVSGRVERRVESGDATRGVPGV